MLDVMWCVPRGTDWAVVPFTIQAPEAWADEVYSGGELLYFRPVGEPAMLVALSGPDGVDQWVARDRRQSTLPRLGTRERGDACGEAAVITSWRRDESGRGPVACSRAATSHVPEDGDTARVWILEGHGEAVAVGTTTDADFQAWAEQVGQAVETVEWGARRSSALLLAADGCPRAAIALLQVDHLDIPAAAEDPHVDAQRLTADGQVEGRVADAQARDDRPSRVRLRGCRKRTWRAGASISRPSSACSSMKTDPAAQACGRAGDRVAGRVLAVPPVNPQNSSGSRAGRKSAGVERPASTRRLVVLAVARHPQAAMALSCGQIEPLWYDIGL